MKYPYIGKNKHGVIMLILSRSKGVILSEVNNGKTHTLPDTDKTPSTWFERKYENITAEYLTNTYGKVENKEHAEFIKLLAESNGMGCSHKVIDEHCNFFYVIDGCLFFSGSKVNAAGNYKLITIPLPPKENTNTPEEDFEMTQIAKNNDITVNVTNSTDAVVQVEKDDKENVVNVFINELPNNGDNLLFGGEDKCKEWPQVGDEVQVSLGVGVVKGIGVANGKKCVFVQLENTCETTTKFSKPPTPEDELKQLAKEIWKENNNDFDDFIDVFSNYIQKKPQ